MTPMNVPISTETVTTTIPTSSEMRAPKTTREKISRPVESVPNQCWAVGPTYRIDKFVAPTSCVAIHGASNATTTKMATIETPIMPRRLITIAVRQAASLSAKLNLQCCDSTSWQLVVLHATRILGSSQRYNRSVKVLAMM